MQSYAESLIHTEKIPELNSLENLQHHIENTQKHFNL